MPSRVCSFACAATTRGSSAPNAHVLAAADDRVRRRERAQLVAERERARHPRRRVAAAGVVARGTGASERRRDPPRAAGDLAFDERELHSADPRRLAGAEDAGQRRRLRVVHRHDALRHDAAEQPRQLDVRHEPEAGAQHVARDHARSTSVGDHHLAHGRPRRALRPPSARCDTACAAKPARYRAACSSVRGLAPEPAAKRATRRAGACSATSTTRAPAARSDAATGSSSGPLPAMTTDLPANDVPDLSSACAPPTPRTPGSVHPGNGRKSSRAPVAITSDVARTAKLVAVARDDEDVSVVRRDTRRRRWRPSRRAPPSARVAPSMLAPREGALPPPDVARSVRPTFGLSSTTTTRAPDSAARDAAAIPAGPAPMTATSHSSHRPCIARSASVVADGASTIPSTIVTRHARRCGVPSIVTRHS